MKNKKGFTLVEIIAVIALLGIIAIIVGINVTNGSTNAKKALLNTKIETIESAAITYGQSNRDKFTKICNDDGDPCYGISNCYCYEEEISVSTLIEAGVLSPDQDSEQDSKKISNPLTGGSLLNEEVIIYQKYNKIYAYLANEEYLDTTNNDTEENTDDKDEDIVNTPDVNDDNPYTKGTLAYEIINNALNGTLEGKTTYIENLSAEGMVDNMTTSDVKILSTAEDDYGTTYYFRGNPIDNYVEFADMCWRVVRIQGDGSVKLILASELSCSESNLTTSSGYATDGESGTVGTVLTGHYGYKDLVDDDYINYFINDYINSEEDNSTSARTQLNSWLNRKITSEEQNKLKNDTWCIGDLTNAYSWDDTGEIVGTVTEMISNVEIFLYTAGNKYWVTKTPSYKCETTGVEGETDTNKIGMLTFDEIIYAGGGNSSNSNYYLNNNATTNWWWALSPYYFAVASDFAFAVFSYGNVNNAHVNGSIGAFRPTVSLATGTEIVKGKGTILNPYVIK